MASYARPRTLEEALAVLADGGWRILAGGTDFYPALGDREVSGAVLDLNALDELRGISEESDHLVIGARTTWSELIRHPLPPAFHALKQAAREVGSVQIQNVATVAGNLCNASPAADGVPPLLILDAEVELRSAGGTRRLPLSTFIQGNRRTALAPDELLCAIRIPRSSLAGASSFFKLGSRRYLVISIAMAAARIVVDGENGIVGAAVSVGACSPAARRLETLEALLAGCRLGGELDRVLAEADLPELSPIDDVRGSRAYRLEAAREIVARAVRSAASGGSGARVAA